MLFNTAEYLFLFLPFCLLLHFYLKSHLAKTIWLVILSLYFYMVAFPAYIAILLALILVDYVVARLMENCEGMPRKLWLCVSLGSNVLLLASFKYFNFFADNLNALGFSLPKHSWLLPVGLSFHTFQSMSYTIEVFRKAYPVEKNVLRYSLYVLFFPQMVAGPIERPQNILPQLKTFPAFQDSNFKEGCFLLAKGLFMKAVVADRLTQFVDPVFKNPGQANGYQCALAMLFFSLQIYADFSGYSNMALGTAKMLGIQFMVNFNKPYLASSLTDFWRRWHISLSTWFRDYVYIPLGGNRLGKNRALLNILVIFSLSGLWHGAGWNYILWGALHGIGVGLESRFAWKQKGIFSYFRTQLLVIMAWVFFRASNASDAFLLFKRLFSFPSKGIEMGMGEREIAFCIFLLPAVVIAEKLDFAQKLFLKTGWWHVLVLLMAAYFLGNFNSHSFIYFQF